MFLKDVPFQKIDNSSGTKTTDKLVQAKIQYDQEQGDSGQGVHRPTGQPFGKSSSAALFLADHTVKQPLADSLSFQADSQVQIHTPGKDRIINRFFDICVQIALALFYSLNDLVIPLQKKQAQGSFVENILGLHQGADSLDIFLKIGGIAKAGLDRPIIADGVTQLPESTLAPPDSPTDNRNLQFLLQQLDVYLHANPLCFIHDINQQHHRQSGFNQLQGHRQHAFKIASVNDMQHDVW